MAVYARERGSDEVMDDNHEKEEEEEGTITVQEMARR